jgi:hypothetical protein
MQVTLRQCSGALATPGPLRGSCPPWLAWLLSQEPLYQSLSLPPLLPGAQPHPTRALLPFWLLSTALSQALGVPGALWL